MGDRWRIETASRMSNCRVRSTKCMYLCAYSLDRLQMVQRNGSRVWSSWAAHYITWDDSIYRYWIVRWRWNCTYNTMLYILCVLSAELSRGSYIYIAQHIQSIYRVARRGGSELRWSGIGFVNLVWNKFNTIKLVKDSSLRYGEKRVNSKQRIVKSSWLYARDWTIHLYLWSNNQ